MKTVLLSRPSVTSRQQDMHRKSTERMRSPMRSDVWPAGPEGTIYKHKQSILCTS